MRPTQPLPVPLRPEVRWTAVIVGLAAFACPPMSAAQGLSQPRPNDRHIARVVQTLMERENLAGHPLDDEISRRMLQSFLGTLDPMKMYFYQSDVDEFQQQRDELDDMLKKSDVSFAYTVFQRFLQRADERVRLIDEFINQEHDFAAKEKMTTDPESIAYAVDEAEARERWRKRIKYDLLVLKQDEIEGERARDRLSRRYKQFAQRMHATSADELLEMYLTALATSFDPHSAYLAPGSFENYQIEKRRKLEGIGAALRLTDGELVVAKIVPGTAADKHGKLRPEDRIVSVGQGRDGEMVPVQGMKLYDIVQLIRGRTGTVVRLGVIPAGGGDTRTYEIVRGGISLRDNDARGQIIETGGEPDDPSRKIGLIVLPNFYMDVEGAKEGRDDYASAADDVAKILNEFTDKNVDDVILDLRNSRGDSLQQAVAVTGLFIDRGPVVQVKGSGGHVQCYHAPKPDTTWTGPLVVLTNRFTSGAGEIPAAAVQDYRRGIVVGDSTTSGKGTYQQVLDLGTQLFRIPKPPNLGALKITMQQVFRPSGNSIQQRGVSADIVLASLTEHMDVGEASLTNAIPFDQVPAKSYTPSELVNEDMLARLRAASRSRCIESDDFAKLRLAVDHYKQQKASKRVPLNESDFNDQRAQPDEEIVVESRGTDAASVRKDFYLQEVIAIALDYQDALQANKKGP